MRNKIFSAFEKQEYNFLRDNTDLKNVIYLTLSGSYGYGTNIDTSDIDLRGVLVEQPKYLYGLQTFEQFENRETDTVIYGLKKFINLCINANPNSLELLGTDEDCIYYQNESGKLLRENVDIFLTKRVIYSFGNYATAQLRRLSNALCRDHYEEVEKQKHISETLISQMEHFNRTHTSFDDNAIKIYINEQDELVFDIDLKGYPLKDFVSIYSGMSNTVKTYGKLNHRNRKKDDKKLYKHAMHLIRLLITGKDILNGKGLITRRTKENELLMNIRNGYYTFDELIEMSEEYMVKFNESAQNSSLPKRVDKEKVDQLMFKIYDMNRE